MLILTIIFMLRGLLQPVISSECIAQDPCVCESKPKDLLINYLLGDFNRNEANLKIFHNIFNHGSSVVNCSHRAVKSIPKFKLLGYSNQPTIDCLDLSNNQLEAVSDSNFYGLILVCIDFSSNRINRMSRNAFKGLLASLVVLKASNNQLYSDLTFPAYFISKLNRLQVLDLAGNKLDRIVDKSFQTMSEPSLKYLDLHSNVLECIFDDAFDGCKSITYLNLCYNRLGLANASNCARSTDLDLYFLHHLPALENLQLCSNQISKLNGGGENFKWIGQLKTLNLENNLFKSISGLFCDKKGGLKNLQILNLAFNKLTNLNQHDLNCLFNLHELYLHSNELKLIGFSTFKNLNHLRLLTLNNNFNLIPSPSMLEGLENSLMHLAINFRLLEDEEAESILNSEFEFDKLIDYLIISNRLRSLEALDLSESRFHRAYLNLASLLLTKNALKKITCHNCSIRYLKYKYELSENQHYLPENVGQMESNEFNKYYKMYVCYRELNERYLKIDLGANLVGNCHWHSLRFSDEIDVNVNYNINNCFNKRIHFIQKLARFIRVKNFHCNGEKKKRIEWNEYNMDKFSNYTYRHNCLGSNIKCAQYFKRTSSGEWKSIFNSSKGLQLDKTLLFCWILFVFKF